MREGEREIEVQLKKIKDLSEVRVIFLSIHLYKNDFFKLKVIFLPYKILYVFR